MSSFREFTDYPISQPWAAAAALATGNFPVATLVPFKGSLVRARFVPSAAITANGANFAAITLQNKGTNGLAGSTAMASRSWAAGNSLLSTGEDLVLNGTPANLIVNEGDQLNVNLASTGGAGLALPAGTLIFFFAPHF